MGATYTRQSNFTDGDVITADLFNNEFDQLLAAFASSTGHTHDGTAGEGGPITLAATDVLTIGTNAGDVSIVFNGGSNDGTLKWMEDEDYFEFSDDILIATTEKIQFTNTSNYIHSASAGNIDLVAATEIHLTATTINMDGAADISGNLGIGGNLTVTGTTTFNGGTITLGDAATDNVVFAADVDSSIIPDDDDTYDLGSATQEWRDLFLDGTAHIDTLDVDVNATVAGTLGVTGIATFTDDIIIGDGKTIGSASDVDAITIAANGQLTLTQTLIGTALDISGDVDIDGTTNLDVVDIDGAVDMATTLAVAGNVDFNGDLDVDGTTNLDVVDIDGAVDMASTLAVTGIATFTDDIIIGDGKTIGSASDIDAITIAANGQVTLTQTLIGTALDISGDIDVDGVTNLDVVDIDGAVDMASTALVTGVLTTTAATVFNGGFASNADSTISTNKKLIFRDSDIHISSVNDGDLMIAANDEIDLTSTLIDINGNVEISGTTTQTGVITANAGVVVDEMTLDADTLTATDDFIIDAAGNIEINADGGTVTFKDADAVLGTVTSAGFSGTSAGIVVTDNNANTNFPVVFHDESNGLLDDTGALRYNPSTGELLVPKLTVAGTTTTVDTVTMQAANAIIFEGATADAHETTLTIVDPTADRTINMPNQSGTIAVLAAASNTAITSTPEELNALDGITAVVGELNALDIGSTAVGIAVASKAVILDSSKDYTGIRNLTITGELDAATLDISGAIDVEGTANLDVVDIDGAVDMASTLQVDGVATFTGVPIASAGLSVKNGATGAGFIQFFEDSDNGSNKVTLIGPASTADVTLTLPSAAGIVATTDDATALAIALG